MPRKRTKTTKKAAPKVVQAPAAPPDPPVPAPAAPPAAPMGALEEAIVIRASVKARLDRCDPKDMAKYVDAYSRAANVVRQLEKDRKRELAAFTDDEVIEYLRSLPERRREAIHIAVQGTSLAGKPLF